MLIVGASGGVGTYAVQIAVAMGATVTGVASGSKADLVTALGAQHVIDYTRDDFADGSHTYDVVVDIGGMTSVSRLRRALQPKGTLVIVGGESGSKWSPGMGRQLKAAAMSPIVSQRLTSILNKEHYSGLDRLAKLAATGDVAPRIERSYSLAEVARRGPPTRGRQGPRPDRHHTLSQRTPKTTANLADPLGEGRLGSSSPWLRWTSEMVEKALSMVESRAPAEGGLSTGPCSVLSWSVTS